MEAWEKTEKRVEVRERVLFFIFCNCIWFCLSSNSSIFMDFVGGEEWWSSGGGEEWILSEKGEKQWCFFFLLQIRFWKKKKEGKL